MKINDGKKHNKRSRREFIKGVAASSAGLIILPRNVVDGKGSIASSGTIKPGKGKIRKLFFNPYKYVNFDSAKRYKANYHQHTTESDGRDTVLETMEKYKFYGFDILAISDHDCFGETYAATFPWSNYTGETPTPKTAGRMAEYYPSKGLLAVAGNELSGPPGGHHRNTLFTTFWTQRYEDLGLITNQNLLDVEWTLTQVEDKSGLSFFSHPGYHQTYSYQLYQGNIYTPEYYIEIFKKLNSCLGLEVYNENTEHAGDRVLWDLILTEMMPHRPVWGLSNSDDHGRGNGIHGTCYNTHFMDDLTSGYLRRSLERGEFYFSYDPLGQETSGGVPTRHNPVVTPIITNIEVTELSISITATNTREIHWISGVEQTDSGVATNGTDEKLVDSSKSWRSDEHVGSVVILTGGTGSIQRYPVASNTATELIIRGKMMKFNPQPSNDTEYVIVRSRIIHSGHYLPLTEVEPGADYVRARLIGSNGGFSYTQPFGLTDNYLNS